MADFEKVFEDDDIDSIEQEIKTPLWKKLLKWVGIPLLGILLLIIIFVIGLVSGSAGSSESNAPKEVTSIQGQSSVLDSLETLKDSQNQALIEQINRAGESGSGSGNSSEKMTVSEQDKQLQVLLKERTENQKPIDAFLDQVMSIKNSADSKELDVTIKAIQPLMTKEAGASTAYDIAKGESASKSVGENGRKAGASNIYTVDSNDRTKTYLVITPFATDAGVSHQVSLVKVEGDLISNYRFIGMLESSKPEVFENALKDFSK